jgi:hypothetical protein
VSADDGKAITLRFSVGPVQVWRSKEFSLVWCEGCVRGSKPVAFLDSRIGDDILHELCDWHLATRHAGNTIQVEKG